jgi:hypothetical protein
MSAQTPVHQKPLWRVIGVRIIPYLAWGFPFILFLFISWNVVDLSRRDAAIQTFEQGALRITISHPQKVGRGETGYILVMAENLHSEVISDTRIALLNDGYLWFPDGNQAYFENLPPQTQGSQILTYTLDSSLPYSVTNTLVTAYIEYRIPVSSTLTSRVSAPIPLSRVYFAQPLQLSIKTRKQIFNGLLSVLTAGSNRVGQVTALVTALAGVWGSIALFNNKFRDVFKPRPKRRF